MSKLLGVLFAVLVLPLIAKAEPIIHPELKDYFQNPSRSHESRAVILVFKHKRPLPTGRYLPSDRARTQMLLMKNAEASQQNVMKVITDLQKEGVIIYSKSYWLNNTMGVYSDQKTIKKVILSDDIIAVYPNRVFHLALYAIHPQISQRADNFTYGLQKLRIPEVRLKKNDLDGRGVKVGILDTGIDATHGDLQGRTLVFKDFVNEKANPYDDHGHGTHVAGTISGGNASGPSIGVAPAVKLVIAKIFNKNGSASEAKILEAMQWVADPDGNPSTNDAPALVSNSWGGGSPTSSVDPKDEPECRAVDGWVKLGIAPIFAAGNSGSSPKTVNIPGACPAAIAVGATDSQDQIANFSSRGPAVWSNLTLIKPLVSAPGVKVYSSMPGGKYGEMSGTSMATPHTSGLAALIYQMNPNSDVESVGKALAGGAIDLGEKGNDNTFGWGRIDALNTLKLLYSGAAQ